MSESLLGEHWTRASNVVVRRAKEEVKDDLCDFSPHSVQLADFQLQMVESPREETRRKSRRISSLREKSEQDLQQLRRASQSKSASPMAPNQPNQAQKPMRKARKSKERIDLAKSGKVASMMRECLQIANFRLLATSREVSEKLSASLQNTRNPSVWPAHMAPLQPAPSAIELDGFVPKKNYATALPVVWFDIKLVKMHAFNERLEQKVKSDMNHNDPEMHHLAFQEAMDEARRIQAQAVTAKNEVRRLKRAVALQRTREVRATLRESRASPRRGGKPQAVTLPTIVVTGE